MPNPTNSPGRSKSGRSRRSRKNKNKGGNVGGSSSSVSSSPGSLSSTSSHGDESITHIHGGQSPLEQTLLELGCFEPDDSHRRTTLDYIEKILARWALTLSSLSSNSNYSDNSKSDPWQRPRVALIPFGSYRLGVHRPESDLDLLALAPSFCTRHDFFSSLVQLLMEDPEVSQLHPISSAYTPVIKFVVKSLQIDLVFARVSDTTKLLEYQQRRLKAQQGKQINRNFLTDMYMIDDSDLLGLDEAGVRSLNGARVSQILLQYVEPFCPLDNYRTVLRAVKQWAIQVGVYSNVLGFLGGVNWAILVAWVCRNHPGKKKSASQLLKAFFRTFAAWKWPMPVLLAPIQDTPPDESVPYLPAWNPVANPRDGLHIMPIITPAYPSMNSSYNVGIPQLRRIIDEMTRASNLLKEEPNNYKALLAKESDFFERHTHFLQINIRANNRQDFVEWFRLVESRLRLLIVALETPYVHAWPFAKFFERKYNSKGVCIGSASADDDDESGENCIHEKCFFIGLRFAPDLDQINLCHYTSDFLYKVNTWEGRKFGMDLSISHVTDECLPSFLIEEMGMTPADRNEDDGASDGHNDQENQHDPSDNPACDSSSESSVPTMEAEGFSHLASSPMKRCRIMT